MNNSYKEIFSDRRGITMYKYNEGRVEQSFCKYFKQNFVRQTNSKHSVSLMIKKFFNQKGVITKILCSR